jgi:two-component system cell cycle sensor histidine kinase/response regulator CckA
VNKQADEPSSDDEVQALRARVSELETALREQRQAGEQTSERTEKLESLSVLAGGIAHDFNNLLGGLLNYATLALSRIDTAVADGANAGSLTSARKAIENAQVAGKRMAELAKQMLIYSGRGQVIIETVDLSALVTQMRESLEGSVDAKAQLRFDLADPLPPIDADAEQLRGTVEKLVANSVEALREDADGEITIATRLVRGHEIGSCGTYAEGPPPAGLYVALEVSDNGQGMQRATLERIFDPFFSTKATGRGLGLSTVLGSARGHSGAVAVRSQPGSGSSLLVLLPVVAAWNETFDRDNASSGAQSGKPARRPEKVAG